MQIKKLSLVVMAALVLTLGLAGCGNAKDTTTSGKANAAAAVVVEQGKLAPDFTVQMLDGSQVKLSSLRGKPVFLNFWATWCPPCVGEMPHFQTFYPKYKDKINFLAVSIDAESSTVQKFVESKGFTFPIAHDGKKNVAGLYSIEAIPTSFLLDKDGKVIAYHLGGMSAGQLQQFLDQAVK